MAVMGELRVPNQAEVPAVADLQHAELNQGMVGHCLTITEPLSGKLRRGPAKVTDYIDATLRRAERLRHGDVLNVVYPHLLPHVTWDPSVMDINLVASVAASNYADVVVLPPARGGLDQAVERLNAARAWLAMARPKRLRHVHIMVDTSKASAEDVIEGLAILEEPLVFAEWHGTYERRLPFLKAVSEIMQGEAGTARPYIVVTNAPKAFPAPPGQRASTALMLATWGVQATAHRLGNWAAAQWLQKKAAASGQVMRPEIYDSASGGYVQALSHPCDCAACDESLSDIRDHEEPALHRRLRVHELHCVAKDRLAFHAAVLGGAVQAFVKARAVLGAALA